MGFPWRGCGPGNRSHFCSQQGTPNGAMWWVGRQPWLCSEKSAFPWMLFPAWPARRDFDHREQHDALEKEISGFQGVCVSEKGSSFGNQLQVTDETLSGPTGADIRDEQAP